MKYTLVRPCSKCPFRTDVPNYLHPERREEIGIAITDHDGTFPCHETIDYNQEDGEEGSQNELGERMKDEESYEPPNEFPPQRILMFTRPSPRPQNGESRTHRVWQSDILFLGSSE